MPKTFLLFLQDQSDGAFNQSIEKLTEIAQMAETITDSTEDVGQLFLHVTLVASCRWHRNARLLNKYYSLSIRHQKDDIKIMLVCSAEMTGHSGDVIIILSIIKLWYTFFSQKYVIWKRDI